MSCVSHRAVAGEAKCDGEQFRRSRASYRYNCQAATEEAGWSLKWRLNTSLKHEMASDGFDGKPPFRRCASANGQMRM